MNFDFSNEQTLLQQITRDSMAERAPRTVSLRLIALILVSGFFACQASPPEITEMSQGDFVENPPDHALVLDVRSDGEFSGGHIPGAISIPHDELPNRLEELGNDRSVPIVVYCESGGRAGIAGEALLAAGFSNVFHLTGDMRAWRENGRPTIR